jgi:PPM family protein phosphatase
MAGALAPGMRIEHAAFTHVGRRNNNEDSFVVEPELGIYAVADGMGGYEGGEIASKLATVTLRDFFARERADAESTWPFGVDPRLSLGENRLQSAVRLAHAEVSVRKKGPLAMMGSTVAAVSVEHAELIVGHVGDSRVYRLRHGLLSQLTRDHSLYAELAASGAPVPPRDQCSFTNVITRALGMEGDTRADVRREPLVAGDVYLLCTDGLTEKLDDAALAVRMSATPVDTACRAMVEEAYALGGRDNITAVLIRVG